MIITKIEPQKRIKNRVSIYLDGNFAFGLSSFDAFKFHLKEGMDIDSETLNRIKKTALMQDARQYTLRLLDARPYTEKGIRDKLKERATNPEVIDETIAFLKEYHYIDDEEYALRYVQSAVIQKKSGRKKLVYDLVAKGIDKDIAENAVNSIPFDESDSIMAIAERKLKGDYSFNGIMKVKRYLFSRGFSNEAIDTVLNRLKNEQSEYDCIE